MSLDDSVEGFQRKYFYVVAANMPACRLLRYVSSDDLEVCKFTLSCRRTGRWRGVVLRLSDLSAKEEGFYHWVNEFVSLLRVYCFRVGNVMWTLTRWYDVKAVKRRKWLLGCFLTHLLSYSSALC